MGSGGARSPPPGTMATLQRGARQTALVEQNPKLPLAIGLKALALVADRYRDGRDVQWVPVEAELLREYKRWLTFKRDGALTLEEQQYWTNQLSKQVVFTKDYVMKWVKYKLLTATGCAAPNFRQVVGAMMAHGFTFKRSIVMCGARRPNTLHSLPVRTQAPRRELRRRHGRRRAAV
jgi:hypothetical protein